MTAKTDTAGLFSDVQVMMARSVNANAGAISTALVDAFVKNNTSLNFYLDPSYARGAAISSVDVDCGALSYCRPGDGTATMGDGGNSPTGVQDQLWTSLDVNHDGFPDVPVNQNGDSSRGPSTRSRSSRTPPPPTSTPATSTSCASPPPRASSPCPPRSASTSRPRPPWRATTAAPAP